MPLNCWSLFVHYALVSIGCVCFCCSQSDVIHQSVYELIHTEDRAEFQQQLHWALNPSNSPDNEKIVQGKSKIITDLFHTI